MNFEKGQLYHIYNQGNNRQKIFFERDNYLFFLQKIRTYILPYADVFAWCLMPNHFHLMVLVNEVELGGDSSGSATLSGGAILSGGATQSRTPTTTAVTGTLNKSLGIMLASYTRAIQKQENFTGSLFRQKTKAECISCTNGVTPSFYSSEGITRINTKNPELQYPQICFNYIHQNPVKAGLVKKAIDWEFSSVQDYAALRSGNLVNKKLAHDYIVFE